MRIPYLNKNFIRVNKAAVAVSLFLLVFLTVHQIKPTLFYTPDGGFRQFGVGYKQKTVIPIWLFAILLAILCYLAVLSFLIFG
jgi:hypothetical protein